MLGRSHDPLLVSGLWSAGYGGWRTRSPRLFTSSPPSAGGALLLGGRGRRMLCAQDHLLGLVLEDQALQHLLRDLQLVLVELAQKDDSGRNAEHV